MKIQAAVLLFAAGILSLCGEELAVNWQESLKATPPGAAVIKGWRLNNSRRNPKIGTGEVVEENGVKYLKIETTGVDTSFHTKRSFPAQAGDTLEIEITAQGKGHLVVSCCCYQADKKFFVPANNKIQYIISKGEKKTRTIRRKLTDGKKGEKLGLITLTLGAGGKSTFCIYDYKAKIIKNK